MQATKLNKITIEEYIAIERENDTRYEYHNGEIFVMAGGTVPHTDISGNVFYETSAKLRAKNSPCRPMNNDLKIQIQGERRFVYPDMSVICGEPEYSEYYKDAVTNPIIIIEVLSDSTEGYDRGGKFFLYRKIQTLQEYILIEQKKPEIDIYTRKEGDLWRINRVSGIENSLALQSLQIEIPLKDIYRNVDFSVSQ